MVSQKPLQVPQTIPGVDPDDIAWLTYCARHDWGTFSNVFMRHRDLQPSGISSFLFEAQFHELEWTTIDLAHFVHNQVTLSACDGLCPHDFYESKAYNEEYAQPLQKLISRKRAELNPDHYGDGCPNVSKYPELRNP